jgi:predicted ATPase
MLCKLVNEGAFFQVTTHSDYFLNQINNSINLFNLKTKLKDKYKDFCKENELDENKILDPKKLGAYYFERRKDGSVEIKTQNVTEGVPFDTFEKSVDTIMRDSAIIENQLEELLD